MFHLSFGFLLDSGIFVQDHWELIFSKEDFFFVFFRYIRKTSLRNLLNIYLINTFFFLNRAFQEIELWLLYFEKFVYMLGYVQNVY